MENQAERDIKHSSHWIARASEEIFKKLKRQKHPMQNSKPIIVAILSACCSVAIAFDSLKFETVADAVRFVQDENNILNYNGLIDGSEMYDVALPSGKKVTNWRINCAFGAAFRKFGKESILPLIELLESETEYLRVGAYGALMQKSGRYDERSHSQDAEKRRAAHKDWKAWWERNKDNPRLNAKPKRVYPAEDWESERQKPALKEERVAFPYFIPGSRIVIGKELVDEVNALAWKAEQIHYLLKILPPANQKEKRLSDRQLYAFRLLGLTDSAAVIKPLLDRLDFEHTGDGWPAGHALARLGERSVEPVVKKLEAVATDQHKIAQLGGTLIEIKGERYPMFLDELKQRKDVNLSDELLKELLDQYRFAPD